MLAECRLRLMSSKPLNRKDLTPEKLHGLFFSMLPKKTAEELHKLSIKPFTLYSPLLFSGKEEFKSFYIRITFLDEKVFVAFTENIIIKQNTLLLGKTEVYPAGFFVTNSLSYQNLLKSDKSTRDFLFHFKSLTTFKKGSFDYPLPDPELIFKSLLRKWNTFSPSKIHLKPSDFKSKLALHGAWIRTEKLNLSKDKKILGFKGRTLIYTSSSGKELELLNTLYRFAPFSGVGRKTTMGLGQVKID